jgi:Tfp pilus assembly protein PilN
MAQQINLFNPVFLKQKKYFSAVTLLQALGLVVAGVLVFYGYAVYESRTQARVAAEASRQLAAQSQQVAALTRDFSPQGRSRLLQEEIARVNTRLKQRQDMLALLQTGGLGNTAGFARYLAALARQSLGGVWLTGFSVSGDEVELNLAGRVLQPDLVPAYLRGLNREDVMRGRRITELRLTAREERDAGSSVTGASPAAAAKPPAAPLRYVEFNLIAVRAPGGAAAAPAKGTP